MRNPSSFLINKYWIAEFKLKIHYSAENEWETNHLSQIKVGTWGILLSMTEPFKIVKYHADMVDVVPVK